MERGISQSREQERNTVSCTEQYEAISHPLAVLQTIHQIHAVFFFTSDFSPETLQCFS